MPVPYSFASQTGPIPLSQLDSNFSYLTSQLGLTAPLISPNFTGSATAPTATLGDSSTLIANTMFVTTAIAARLSAGAVISMVAVTATGAYAQTAPTGTTKALVRMTGGGAGGAAINNGATGGYCETLFSIKAGNLITGGVGAGGASGANGTNTTVTAPGTITAGGGAAGGNGAGGTAGGGGINLPGDNGSPSSGGAFAWPLNHGYMRGDGGSQAIHGTDGMVVIYWLK